MNLWHITGSRLGLAFALLRREYAVQFAGMSLGLAWPLVQYLAQISVFLLVFGRGIYRESGGDHYAFRLLSGMLLWLPLSEMLTRSTTILSANRAVIRRTIVGRFLFPWIPAMQAVLHYCILALPVAFVFALQGVLTRTSPLGFAFGLLVIGFFSGWSLILSRAGVLLRDLGPVVPPALQALFWLTPIAYFAAPWSAWNPLSWVFGLHGSLWSSASLSDSSTAASVNDWIRPDTGFISFAVFLGLSAISFALSFRLKRIVEDHL